MSTDVQFWVQLVTLAFTVIGGCWSIAKFLASKFDKLEGKVEGLTTRFQEKLDTEIKHVHRRVDGLYQRHRINGVNDG